MDGIKDIAILAFQRILHNGLRTADALLRYTKLPIADIAARSGMGTRGNMYFIYEREFNLSPTDRRDQLREKGDLGRYIIK